MATIVQNYGPIYGEVVNGTVQGRPNGSVYVPISNVVVQTLNNPNNAYIHLTGGGMLRLCNSAGTESYGAANNITGNAQAQDLASNLVTIIYSDAGLTTAIGSRSFAAGHFNDWYRDWFRASSDVTINGGDTYYIVLYLNNNGTPVAVSDVIEVTGVGS